MMLHKTTAKQEKVVSKIIREWTYLPCTLGSRIRVQNIAIIPRGQEDMALWKDLEFWWKRKIWKWKKKIEKEKIISWRETKWYNHFIRNWSWKYIYIWLSNSILGIYPREINTYIYTRIFIIALLIIAPNWK